MISFIFVHFLKCVYISCIFCTVYFVHILHPFTFSHASWKPKNHLMTGNLNQIMSSDCLVNDLTFLQFSLYPSQTTPCILFRPHLVSKSGCASHPIRVRPGLVRPGLTPESARASHPTPRIQVKPRLASYLGRASQGRAMHTSYWQARLRI